MGERRILRKQVLLTVDYHPAQYREVYGDEDRTNDETVAEINVVWESTRGPEWQGIVYGGAPALKSYAEVSADLDVRPKGRGDEAGFRRAVPRFVGVLEVVAVGGFRPGNEADGLYATATGLMRTGEAAMTEWSVHTLVWQDDRPEFEWMAHAGSYYSDEDEARNSFERQVRGRRSA